MFFKTFAEKQTERKGRKYDGDMRKLRAEIARLHAENAELRHVVTYAAACNPDATGSLLVDVYLNIIKVARAALARREG